MAGTIVFNTLAEALHAGFAVYDRTSDGFRVRIMTKRGWALAIVDYGNR